MNAAGEAECKLLSDLIQERFGLSFSGVRRDILASRVRPRISALRLDSLLDYYHYLRSHPQRDYELDHLARHLTNNETYFFREPHHFDIIVRHVVPPLMDDLRTRPLRILSAGCSSGEEPYSLAIALHDSGLELRGVSWEIDACDLNRDRLARAREGAYDGSALRACDAEALRRYFEERNGRRVLRERYRRGVRFFEANLATASAVGCPPYDAVLCRNLLIYFDDAGFDRTVRLFARALAPRGYLLLGHSESLIDRSDEFTAVWLEGAMVYRKREAA
ncbi:MAG TPA: protein-glutamate O-methyltransferase CheR [Gemmatimonadales bacterium]|nr:protein-glutamate O-methyltransferase CheR [Gemmatimonadales bacterium]